MSPWEKPTLVIISRDRTAGMWSSLKFSKSSRTANGNFWLRHGKWVSDSAKMTQKEGISPRRVFCILPGHNERYAVFLCGETLSRGPLKCEPRVFKMSHYVKEKKKARFVLEERFSRGKHTWYTRCVRVNNKYAEGKHSSCTATG